VREGRAKDEERETVDDSKVGEEWKKREYLFLSIFRLRSFQHFELELMRLIFSSRFYFYPVLADYCKKNFVDWGEEAYGEGLTRVWTGILTSVKDYLPLVGEIPSSPGLFISAGFIQLPFVLSVLPSHSLTLSHFSVFLFSLQLRRPRNGSSLLPSLSFRPFPSISHLLSFPFRPRM